MRPKESCLSLSGCLRNPVCSCQAAYGTPSVPVRLFFRICFLFQWGWSAGETEAQACGPRGRGSRGLASGPSRPRLHHDAWHPKPVLSFQKSSSCKLTGMWAPCKKKNTFTVICTVAISAKKAKRSTCEGAERKRGLWRAGRGLGEPAALLRATPVASFREPALRGDTGSAAAAPLSEWGPGTPLSPSAHEGKHGEPTVSHTRNVCDDVGNAGRLTHRNFGIR